MKIIRGEDWKTKAIQYLQDKTELSAYGPTIKDKG